MFGVQYSQVVSSQQKYIKKQNNIFCDGFENNDEKFYVIQLMFPHDKLCCIRQRVLAYKLNLDAYIHKTCPEEYKSREKNCKIIITKD